MEKGKAKPIGQFLEFSADFMEQRALKSGEGGSVTWKIKGGSFDFEYHDRTPVVTFKEVDLIGVRNRTLSPFGKQSGMYLPFEGVWRGQGGKVSWAEAGLDSTVYAELTNYKVEAVKPLFQCDSAMLYYPLYFKEGIPGKFENNVVVRSRSATAKPDSLQDFQFPRFESFDKSVENHQNRRRHRVHRRFQTGRQFPLRLRFRQRAGPGDGFSTKNANRFFTAPARCSSSNAAKVLWRKA